MVRFKNRYMLVEVMCNQAALTSGAVSQKEIMLAIRDSLTTNFGDFGLGTAQPGLQVRCLDPANASVCLVRCRCDGYKIARAAMTFVTGYRKLAFALRVLTVASTQRTIRAPLLKAHAAVWRAAGMSEGDIAQQLSAVEEEAARI
eukprot:TRINITY_DN9655_c0_g1_i1.p4 TRINITY_DN9655_c0_g1~~TRINITY_DN9655_c0_g1_i1.p4  ORF type:complete len:145 (+),score=52.72 TRINITY_DN9655_c0_g1_i1:51-485(+)